MDSWETFMGVLYARLPHLEGARLVQAVSGGITALGGVLMNWFGPLVAAADPGATATTMNGVGTGLGIAGILSAAAAFMSARGEDRRKSEALRLQAQKEEREARRQEFLQDQAARVAEMQETITEEWFTKNREAWAWMAAAKNRYRTLPDYPEMPDLPDWFRRRMAEKAATGSAEHTPVRPIVIPPPPLPPP